MTGLSGLGERFRAREFEVRRLCALNPEFDSLCDDYKLAMKALYHWENTENHAERAAEYRQLAGEIGDEITARLDAVSAS